MFVKNLTFFGGARASHVLKNSNELAVFQSMSATYGPSWRMTDISLS